MDTCGQEFMMTPKDGKWEPRNLDGTYHSHPRQQGGGRPVGWYIKTSSKINGTTVDVSYTVTERDKVIDETENLISMLDAIKAKGKKSKG